LYKRPDDDEAPTPLVKDWKSNPNCVLARAALFFIVAFLGRRALTGMAKATLDDTYLSNKEEDQLEDDCRAITGLCQRDWRRLSAPLLFLGIGFGRKEAHYVGLNSGRTSIVFQRPPFESIDRVDHHMT
jgi:hypothetical protein